MSTELVPAEVVEIVEEPTLDELAVLINGEMEAAGLAFRRSIEHVIAAGTYLLMAQAALGRGNGEWMAWIKEKFPGRERRGLSQYMRVATYADEVRDAGYVTMEQALLALRNSKPRRGLLDPYTRSTVQRLRGEGWSYKQICEHTGVPKTTVARIAMPSKARRDQESARNAERRAGRIALKRQQRETEIKKSGGAVASAYSHIRRALQDLDRAVSAEDNEDTRKSLRAAISAAHTVEDRIGHAVRGEYHLHHGRTSWGE